MNRNPYTILGWIAMLTVPLAPAFFFGFEFYKSIYTEIYAWAGIVWVSVIPSVIIGGASALGLEFVGVLSGHTAIKFWERNDLVRAGVCVAILLSYVVLGIVGLESVLTKGVVMFLVAPLVYLLVGMLNELDRAEAEQARNSKRSQVIDYRAKEAAAQREHEARLRKMELDAEVKKEKIHAPQPIPVAPVAAPVAELTETQQRILDVFREQPGATITQVAEMLGVTRQAVSKQVKQMNGVLHEVRI